MKKVFIVDPQARNKGNLALYDYSLFSKMNNYDYIFYGSCDFGFKFNFSNLKFEGIFCYHKYNKFLKGISYTWSMLVFFCNVLIKRPNVIHIEWIRLWLVDYWVYWFISKFTSIRLIYTMHNILPHERKPYDVKCFRKLYHVMDKLIVHTETSKKELLNLFPEIEDKNVVVIPHGLLKLKVDENGVAEATKAIVNKYLFRKKLIFVIIGSQSKYKGTDLLIDAWTNSSQLAGNDEICLIAAGKFSKDVLPSEVPQNLIIDNRMLSEEEFISYIRLADVLLLPYRAIDQSGVLLTILNEGTPYCATDVGELCKPIEVADIGWVIPTASVKDIRHKLLYLVNNHQEVKNKKNNSNAWSVARSLYDWEKIACMTEKMYEC